jgi:histidine ammonia-lyase
MSENRRLAVPSSLDGGVSSGLQEDEIPHATTGALRLLRIVENFHTILAIELLAAAQAFEFQDPALARATAGDSVYRLLRERVARYADAAPLTSDIAAAADLMAGTQPPI